MGSARENWIKLTDGDVQLMPGIASNPQKL